MAKKLEDIPKESKFLPIWNFIKSNKLISGVIVIAILILLVVAVVMQCNANTKRSVSATLWHDFKMVGLYFFGLFSATINILITKFNNWIND